MTYKEVVKCKSCGYLDITDDNLVYDENKPAVICSCGRRINLMKNTSVSVISMKRFSRFLSYILRHEPEKVGLCLREDGYVNTEDLIDAINKYSDYYISLWYLKVVVKLDEKQRYQFSEGYDYIRAVQGHSIRNVKIEFEEFIPEKELYHGTCMESAEKIFAGRGIEKRSRNYVHLSRNLDIAESVGKRHGKVCILKIDSVAMYKDGYKFYKAENGVILTDFVPLKYVSRIH